MVLRKLFFVEKPTSFIAVFFLKNFLKHSYMYFYAPKALIPLNSKDLYEYLLFQIIQTLRERLCLVYKHNPRTGNGNKSVKFVELMGEGHK